MARQCEAIATEANRARDALRDLNREAFSSAASTDDPAGVPSREEWLASQQPGARSRTPRVQGIHWAAAARAQAREARREIESTTEEAKKLNGDVGETLQRMKIIREDFDGLMKSLRNSVLVGGPAGSVLKQSIYDELVVMYMLSYSFPGMEKLRKDIVRALGGRAKSRLAQIDSDAKMLLGGDDLLSSGRLG